MRAPLRSLQGFSDILLNDYADKVDADGQRFLKRIAASAARMDKLIQDVLNYSRVVRGELPLEPVDLDKLLHGIVDTYPAFTPDKAHIVLQEPLPTVLGNEAMLTQIFSNLIGNAVKFVPAGVKPQVKVWAERRTSQVRLFVQDNGIGIEPDQHEKIFSIFQQVSKDFEGTGIGLAIVKKAVERMGGRVGLESELDRGSTFWIEIPAG
jgi:signal transduction histidine kinase